MSLTLPALFLRMPVVSGIIALLRSSPEYRSAPTETIRKLIADWASYRAALAYHLEPTALADNGSEPDPRMIEDKPNGIPVALTDFGADRVKLPQSNRLTEPADPKR